MVPGGLPPSPLVDELAGAVRMRLPVDLSSSLFLQLSVLAGPVDGPLHVEHPGRSSRSSSRLQSSHLPGSAGAASSSASGYMMSSQAVQSSPWFPVVGVALNLDIQGGT